MPKVERICQYCGKTFYVKPCQLRYGEGKHCSVKCARASKRRTLAERFWEKVVKSADPDGCWDWTGNKTPKGYGQIGRDNIPGHNTYAHRVSWELHNGPIPEGIEVLHSCDNPSCCNPRHLFLGTQADNVKDMIGKCRQARPEQTAHKGEKNGRAKISSADVLVIRQLVAAGGNETAIAKAYGISQTNVSAIVLRKVWKHI